MCPRRWRESRDFVGPGYAGLALCPAPSRNPTTIVVSTKTLTKKKLNLKLELVWTRAGVVVMVLVLVVVGHCQLGGAGRGSRNGPSADHGQAVLARAGRMLRDKDYGSNRGWRGSDGRSA